MREAPYPHLFSPIPIHTMTLKNRVVMRPMCTAYATIAGAVTDRLIDYYAARARGGVGLVDVVGIQDLGKSRIPIRRIGDASVPGKLFGAIHAGFKVGIEI